MNTLIDEQRIQLDLTPCESASVAVSNVNANLPKSKDRYYYSQNQEAIKMKAKKKYQEKMKDSKYRWEYLAKQRDYNRRRIKTTSDFEINKLLYPYNPFSNTASPIQIVFQDGECRSID